VGEGPGRKEECCGQCLWWRARISVCLVHDTSLMGDQWCKAASEDMARPRDPHCPSWTPPACLAQDDCDEILLIRPHTKRNVTSSGCSSIPSSTNAAWCPQRSRFMLGWSAWKPIIVEAGGLMQGRSVEKKPTFLGGRRA